MSRDATLRKLYFHFLSHLMGYDHGDSFPFDFEPTGSKPKGKLSPRSYPIPCERKWKYNFLSVASFAVTFVAGQITFVLGSFLLLTPRQDFLRSRPIYGHDINKPSPLKPLHD